MITNAQRLAVLEQQAADLQAQVERFARLKTVEEVREVRADPFALEMAFAAGRASASARPAARRPRRHLQVLQGGVS
jgi:hypothetical protein